MTFAGLNILAILVAAVAGWLVGAGWYTALSKPWLAALDKSEAELKAHKSTLAFCAPFVLAFVANIIMSWMLAGVLGHLGPGQVTLRNGIISAAFLWFGFVVTTLTVNYAFAGRRYSLAAIDGGHWLLVLLVQGAIIGAFG